MGQFDERVLIVGAGPVGLTTALRLERFGIPCTVIEALQDFDGQALSPRSLDTLAQLEPESLQLVSLGTRIGPCVARPGKFICIGLNYADHAAETGTPIPVEPIVFMKATSALSGPNDPVIQPRGSTKLDWEVELARVRSGAAACRGDRRAQSAVGSEEAMKARLCRAPGYPHLVLRWMRKSMVAEGLAHAASFRNCA